ncbi:MAG: hypothetical protein A2075_08715 [Geobacteraceae bacterium GWC2_58_44]|nr:MAG: hypothetical protein A2075_08715 [Geobacteraceae bacterium GWC2_58_44]
MGFDFVPGGKMPVHLQVGKEKKVAVVFSCPGRHEEVAGHPAAQSTGKNLDTLLLLLSQALNRNDLTRANITITNAWPEVEYQAKTGRSEATAKEVEGAGNIERLQQELEDVTDFVIFCGAKAAAVARNLRLKYRPKFVYMRHPGLRGLSSPAAFTVTHDITRYTKAKIFSAVGKKSELFTRFSTVAPQSPQSTVCKRGGGGIAIKLPD